MTPTFPVHDPSTGEVLAHVPDAGVRDATAAVDAAASVFPAWAAAPPRTRSEVLYRAFELVRRDANGLAALIAAENGKPMPDARAEVAYAAEFFRWYAEEAVRPHGDYGSSPAGGTRTLVTSAPVGVAALVTPWNFPAAMVTRKVAPALAAGCTVVLKPAAETPLTALALARLLAEAGVPDGVVTVLPTTDAAGVVGTWLGDPRVRKLSFTGSTRVGRLLQEQAARRMVNTSMELGGNAAFIVTEDADISAALDGAMAAKFRGGGQACTAANRFLVHAHVAAEFTARLAARVEALRVGPSSDAATQVGPLISAAAVENMERLVKDAVARGARVEGQARAPEGNGGHYFPPTVLADVPPDADAAREEIFGPIAPVVTWRTDVELLALANGTEAGLAAYVYAGDLARALRIGEALEAGMVGVNRGLVSDPSAPFGGVKQSGLGREGARAGIDAFLEPKYLSVAWPA